MKKIIEKIYQNKNKINDIKKDSELLENKIKTQVSDILLIPKWKINYSDCIIEKFTKPYKFEIKLTVKDNLGLTETFKNWIDEEKDFSFSVIHYTKEKKRFLRKSKIDEYTDIIIRMKL